ncbi:MAG: Plug domain-containing protein, partial [Gemmatimonadales bacterium]|nr:Plug domain-containing protein [Gemmatimonadales bacterium]
MIRPGIAAILLAAGLATGLGAQVPDTTRLDSLPPDTTDYTALFLKGQQDGRKLIPVPPRIGSGALLPWRTRLIIARDSIQWHNSETLGDILTKIPGVYLLRGGWGGGRPELPTYQAHGATSTEYLIDGMPYLPIGQDSVMADPTFFPLSLIDRIEIEKLPGLLRIFLFTHRNDRSVPYSHIGIASGDLQIARYQGELQRRSAKGPGIALAFDHHAVPSQPSTLGEYSNTQGLVRFEYVPSARAGAEVQFFQSGPDREPVLNAAGDTVMRGRHGTRHDWTGRLFWSGQRNGLGPRLDLVVNRTTWVDQIEKDSTIVLTDSIAGDTLVRTDTSYNVFGHRRAYTQAGLLAAYRLAAASLEGSLFLRSTWTPVELRVRGGISPTRFFTAGADVVHQRHDGERTSQWIAARAGVRLPFGFVASAVWRKGTAVAAPS